MRQPFRCEYSLASQMGIQLIQLDVVNEAWKVVAFVGIAVSNQVCNPVDQNGGFAAACARQDEKRTIGCKNSFSLFLV